MESIGKLLTCDRCRSYIFLNFLGETEVDGGYTRYSQYEEPPEGWAYVHPDITKKMHSVLLCPACSRAYTEAMHALNLV